MAESSYIRYIIARLRAGLPLSAEQIDELESIAERIFAAPAPPDENAHQEEEIDGDLQ